LEVDLGDVVELVLIDEGLPYDVSHPFHMHGHAFFVVAMQRRAGQPNNFGAKGHKSKVAANLNLSIIFNERGGV